MTPPQRVLHAIAYDTHSLNEIAALDEKRFGKEGEGPSQESSSFPIVVQMAVGGVKGEGTSRNYEGKTRYTGIDLDREGVMHSCASCAITHECRRETKVTY